MAANSGPEEEGERARERERERASRNKTQCISSSGVNIKSIFSDPQCTVCVCEEQNIGRKKQEGGSGQDLQGS